MLDRLLSTFSGRKLQAYQISRWRRIKLSNINIEDCPAIREACNCLFTVTEGVIEDPPPREVGALVSVLHRCVEALIFFIGCELSDPAVAEVHAFGTELRDYIETRLPDAGICITSVLELAALVTTLLHRKREWSPEYATALADIERPDCTEEQVDKAFRMHWRIMKRIIRALFHGLLPKLRAEHSLMEMVAITYAYRQKSCDYDDFPFLSDDCVKLEVDDTEAEYQGTGRRVALSSFCKPAKFVPRDMECSICVTEFDGTEEAEDQLPVLTECWHTFHKLCLDKWVNDSAMKASNTCPSCRTILCKPRKRLDASLEDAPLSEASDESDISSSVGSIAGSVVTMPPQTRLQRLNARITTHLSSVVEVQQTTMHRI